MAGERAARIVALGLGAGLSPWAPGTAGSLLGVALGAGLLGRGHAMLAAGTLVATMLGLWSVRAATGLPWRGTAADLPKRGAASLPQRGAASLAKRGAASRDADPGWIVIDEVAGQMLGLLAAPRPSWPWLLAAFALFRLFDIAKPGPIGWADRHHGVLGIMADDLLAGVATALVLLAARAA